MLRPIRNRIRRLDLGDDGERVLARMDLRNIHFADLVNTFFDYAIISRYVRQTKVAELEQVSGARQKSKGVAHAPLIYAQDPRTDVPAALNQRLVGVLGGSEHRIVAGWLRLAHDDELSAAPEFSD